VEQRFRGRGDEAPGRPSGDIVCVVRQRPHPLFVRHGSDLLYLKKVCWESCPV